MAELRRTRVRCFDSGCLRREQNEPITARSCQTGVVAGGLTTLFFTGPWATARETTSDISTCVEMLLLRNEGCRAIGEDNIHIPPCSSSPACMHCDGDETLRGSADAR
jgi:hypothetical protein